MRSLKLISSHDEARRIAQALGFSSAEQLKGEYTNESVARFDMYYDKNTKEIVLMRKTGTGETATGLYLPRGW